MDHTAPTRLLVRTADVSPAVLAFADDLEALSGHPTALVVDARAAGLNAVSRSTIALSRAACAAVGLYCPEDFAWKCGDYGYYLARQRFPQTRQFWMIETDVRFYGDEPAEFFRFFDGRQDVDFLATQLRPAGHAWFWRQTARARDAQAFRCLFPVTRLSSRAIDATLSRRIEHGRRRRRRLLWPNDEALVATTLLNGDFVCRDINDFGRQFYSRDTFYFGRPIDGDRFQPDGGSVQLAHPVLFGASYAARLAKARALTPSPPWLQRRLQWAANKLNAVSRW